MAKFICMDGLGGCPIITFGKLKEKLEKAGHTVVLVALDGIETHEDRIARVIQAYDSAIADDPQEQVFFVGQSAGGSAVRVAAERIGGGRRLLGVIMMSPAMPFLIWYLTRTLLPIMAAKLHRLMPWSRGTIRLTADQHRKLVSPGVPEMIERAVAARSDVSAAEARTLAFNAPRLGRCSVPVFHICGRKDAWIAPSAQVKLMVAMKRSGWDVEFHEMTKSGHVPLLSEEWRDVVRLIESWADSKQRARLYA